MAISSKQAAYVVTSLCLVLLFTVGCKPETPPNRASQTGALASPMRTPLPTANTLVSPIQTPLLSATQWALTPEPTATATPLPDKLSFYEHENHYSLKLLPGWYAYNAHGGEDSVTNYDDNAVTDLNRFQPGNLKINIGVGKLSAGQSLQQWVADRISVNTSSGPDSPMPTATATEPEAYALGHNEGLAYYIDSKQLRIMEIVLPWGDHGVMVVDVMPADSSALREALSMLSTINYLP